MPAERIFGGGWLENWRYPPPRASSNFSTLLSYAVVAQKTVFPPYDAAVAQSPESGSANLEGGHLDHSSTTTGSFVIDVAPSDDPDPISYAPGESPVALFHNQASGKDYSYSTVIFLITVLLISTSLICMYVICTSDALKNVIGHYLISLAFTDFLTGVLVTPLAFYASMSDAWRYDNERTLCKVEAYLGVTLYGTSVYVFMWIGVDRHAALKRPSRYEAEQTLTRCKCWIVFTWITAALLCCPTLFGEMQARYYHQTFLCVLDWRRAAPYSVTLAILILAPSFITVTYSYQYIIRKLCNSQELDDTQKTQLDTDPTYVMSFFVILFHFVSWTPWFGLKAYETLIIKHELSAKPLHFCLIWLAIGGANWKIFIYTSMSPEFRKRLRHVIKKMVACFHFRKSSDITDNTNSEFLPFLYAR